MGTGSSPLLEDLDFSFSILACSPYFEKLKEGYDITLLSIFYTGK
jgi:hypothetical protein